MRAGRHYQPLSYDLLLPDEAQEDALRLLDLSRTVVNAALIQLWPYLDEFMKESSGPAWKQVVALIGSPDPHGDRQWRCEAETAGRIMRGQAEPDMPVQLSRPLFVNTGGLDGHQARTRRQIDQLQAKRAKLEADDPRRALYEQEITCCWRLYEARNQQLAHLAANLLLLFAAVWGCALISGESLKTLKTTGRGRGVRGKWRNWRNNTTIRADIWHILRYKSHLLGIRFRSERPPGTSHTCPRCGKPAHTYRSPRANHRSDPVKWGRWLICSHCSYSADRDYAAAVNVARLGMAYLSQMQMLGKAQACSVTDEQLIKPCPYMAHGAVPLFPPQTLLGRLVHSGKIYLNGWKKSCTIRSSYATPLLLRLCS